MGMARGSTQSDTATSQFFINLENNTDLNYNPAVATPNGYAVFGQVLQTATADAVLSAIASVPTTLTGGLRIVNAANEVVIRSAVRVP